MSPTAENGSGVGGVGGVLTCADCAGAITSGRAMRAGKRFWHERHFCCAECGARLRDAKVCKFNFSNLMRQIGVSLACSFFKISGLPEGRPPLLRL